jgi:succinate--hydroxymethylglutarate CoA-transferase
MTEDGVMGVLSGIRVLSVEQYGAGPFGTQALADLGAEIIKIENPHDGGDVSRGLGPYFHPELAPTADSLFFQSLNRNKKSVALDLASEAGRAVFRDLVQSADAVACNLRGDVPDRLGLTYASLGAIKPEIVCCHLTAYGRNSSRAKWPGYDYLIQAETGYFSLNGEPEAAPSRFGLSIVDFMTGYALALSVTSGLLEARATGKGRDIDVSLYDVGLANLNYMAAWAMNAGFQPERTVRSAHPSLVPCQLFPTSDGWIYIMANKEKFFPLLCDRLGAPDLVRDDRFVDFSARRSNRDALTQVLDPLFRGKTTAEWMALLEGTVPCAPILDMGEALASPFTRERGMVVDLADPAGVGVRVVGSPFGQGEETPKAAAPALGADTDAVLSEAGYDAAGIAALRHQGTIA